MSRRRRKALEIAKLLNVKVEISKGARGRWIGGRTIEISPKAGAYTILHEIGHVLCGYACCREHCEFEAQGAAIALARVFGIKFSKKEKQCIDYYAGRTPRRACGVIQARKKISK